MVFATSWHEAARHIKWRIEPFIGGRSRPSSGREFVDNVNPATEESLCRMPIGAPADIDEAVQVARQRFEDGSWSRMTPAKRAEVLFKLADLISKHKGALALLDSVEMGKPIQAALYDAEVYAVGLLRSWAGFADKLLGETAPLSIGNMSLNVYEPRGVVGAITPWNFPSVNAVYKLGPALAAGNTLVLKPSELAPSSALLLAQLALDAGIPEGVFNVVPGLGRTVGAALATHLDVDFLTFTGSTATGRRIAEMAARSNGKPTLMECGGKSPHIVFEDAPNLDYVAEEVIRGVLWNQGQVCSAHTRLVVQSSVKGPLLERLTSKASKCEAGDPLDEVTTFGPLASTTQRNRVRQFIDDGIAAGANAVLRGAIQNQGGCYVMPTIFDQVRPEMPIIQEEIFGPVLCVQEFSTEEEALRLANGTPYGLVATVWTQNLPRALRMASSVKAGAVTLQTSGSGGIDSGCALSFEPQKASGFGSELGLNGLRAYSNLKLLTFLGS